MSKPYIWYKHGQWWVGLDRHLGISWAGNTIQEAWNRRINWLTKGLEVI